MIDDRADKPDAYTYAPFTVPPPDPTIPTYTGAACDWCGADVQESNRPKHKAFHDQLRAGAQAAQSASSEATRAIMQNSHWQGDGCWHHG